METPATSSALRTTARRLRHAWDRVRPFPLPTYVPGTPRVGSGHQYDVYLPPTALTLGAAAMSKEVHARVREVIDTLTSTPHYEDMRVYYDFAHAKFGSYWRYADVLTAVCAATGLLRPQSYLEIGVWRGRSAAVVGATWPTCDIYGFDLWVPGYHGIDNPGPDFVREELRRAGHKGSIMLVSGDSRATVPAFLREHSDIYFDLITIDGNKSIPGWAADFAHTLPRLKVGGIVITDDLPSVPALRRVWDKLVRRNVRYVNWEFIDAGFGVAAAIRVAD